MSKRSVTRSLHRKFADTSSSAENGIMSFSHPQHKQAVERQLLELCMVVVG